MSTNRQKTTTKAMNAALWTAQGLLAAGFLWAAAMKLGQPADKLAAMWPWTVAHPMLVKSTGVLDLLAGAGLVLPAALRIRPRLTVYAAYGTVLLMIAASVFHIMRGEAGVIGINIFFAVLAVFVVWGRK